MKRFILSIITFFYITSCAHDQNEFFDPWKKQAEQSQKATTPLPKNNSKSTEQIHFRDVLSNQMHLPTGKVSLSFSVPTDIAVVLRTLAIAANLNILINATIEGKITANIKDSPWNEAFLGIIRSQGLAYTWEGNILRILTLDEIRKEIQVDKAQADLQAQRRTLKEEEPLAATIIDIAYADPKKVKEVLENVLSKDSTGKPRGAVAVDDHNNAVLLQAIRDDIVNKMIPLIQKLDRPTAQILIKANIIETNKETASELGVLWGAQFPTATNKVGIAANLSGNANVSDGEYGLNFRTVTGGVLQARLNAMQKSGKLNILSSPSIITLDNQTAFTENGEKIPYVSTSNTGAGFTNEVRFEDAVLRLEITPHIINRNLLKLKVEIKKDEVDPIRTVQGNPFIIKKRTQTTMLINDGETVVISGLSKTKQGGSFTGVWGLSKIPILGWFFRTNNESELNEEVLIFITPKILRSPA